MSPCRYPDCNCGIQGCGQPMPKKPAPYTPEETTKLILHLTAECERAARRMRYLDTRPEELRAYTGRIESDLANLVALCLESAARTGREYLAEQR